MSRQRLFASLCATLSFLNLFDAIATATIVTVGAGEEVNPAMALLIRHGGPFCFIVVKIVVVEFGIMFLRSILHHPWALRALAALNGLYVSIALVHVYGFLSLLSAIG